MKDHYDADRQMLDIDKKAELLVLESRFKYELDPAGPMHRGVTEFSAHFGLIHKFQEAWKEHWVNPPPRTMCVVMDHKDILCIIGL